MSEEKPVIHKGLEGIYVYEQSISIIKGEEGKLYYRGYRIEDLAEHSCYEEVCYLLWYGKLPTRKEFENFKGQLAENRELPPAVIDLIKRIPKDTHPMEALRTVVSYIGNMDPGRFDLSLDGMYRKAIRLTAKMPTIIAALIRTRQGYDVIDPDPRLGHSENFLYMIHGKRPPELWAKAMDVSNILYAEHGMNASAFTTLVIGSTLSDYYSAIVGGIGALRGPLHGGANELALRQFLEIGDVNKVEEWYKKARAEKRRIMGFGHRVYKAYDPRARIFREYARTFAEREGGEIKKLYDIALKLEEVATAELAEKRILTNVDYWSGIPYMAMGIPLEFFTPLFAMSRVAGWSAHLFEYVAQNRLIRPRAYYIGEIDKPYIPIEKRE